MEEKLSQSLEDYLEAIFVLESAHDAARAKDIADKLNVKRASVTGALQVLSDKGLINYQPYSTVTLTPEGFRLASRIMHRHKVLQEFMHKFLHLPPEVAEANACRLEHYIDDEALERLTKFAQFVQDCPRTGEDWLTAFTDFCEERKRCTSCVECMENCLGAQKAKAK